jgi:hypothetical protein
MTSRQFRIGGLVLSAAAAALGISALAEAKYATGAFWLAMSVAWTLLAFFRNNTLRGQERRRQRLEAKYASRPTPAQPEHPPRWCSPDNPPGWYLNPATNEPAYWSEIGWRTKEPSPNLPESLMKRPKVIQNAISL